MQLCIKCLIKTPEWIFYGRHRQILGSKNLCTKQKTEGLRIFQAMCEFSVLIKILKLRFI